MNDLDEIFKFNQDFVENKHFLKYNTTKYPNKNLAILSCMDTRLTELLPAALNIQNGDVKMIKNAGALVTNPFGSVMRSLIVAIYELNVSTIYVINHYDCGMQNLDTQQLTAKMIKRGVTAETIEYIKYLGVDTNKWLHGFDDPENSVKETVKTIKSHPFIPKDVTILGFLIDPSTGKLDLLDC